MNKAAVEDKQIQIQIQMQKTQNNKCKNLKSIVEKMNVGSWGQAENYVSFAKDFQLVGLLPPPPYFSSDIYICPIYRVFFFTGTPLKS